MSHATSLAITATTTHRVSLRPTVKKKLQTALRAYAELKTQIKVLEHALDIHKAEVAAIREETGESALELDGFKIAYVQPTRTTVDTKEMVLRGWITVAQLEDVTTTKPVKAYTKITLPGEKDVDYGR